MKRILASSSFIVLLVFSGCSMMPYNDTFECSKGVNTHICERVSDVYQNSDEIVNKSKSKSKNYDYYVDNKIIFKELQELKSENKDLKNMVESISYTLLQKPIEVVVTDGLAKTIKNKLKKTKTNPSELKKLNKYIKVCVANANIRALPSCKAKVVKVVKKGAKLYALSVDKNGWIKLKDSNYIHRSVTNESCNN